MLGATAGTCGRPCCRELICAKEPDGDSTFRQAAVTIGCLNRQHQRDKLISPQGLLAGVPFSAAVLTCYPRVRFPRFRDVPTSGSVTPTLQNLLFPRARPPFSRGHPASLRGAQWPVSRAHRSDARTTRPASQFLDTGARTRTLQQRPGHSPLTPGARAGGGLGARPGTGHVVVAVCCSTDVCCRGDL